MADNLLDKASILLTPTAYNDGSMLSVKPENGDGDFDFSRSSAATRVNAQGLVEEITDINLPRIDYTDGCGSWLLEPQSTNLIRYSEDFSSAWLTNGTITPSYGVSPSGVNNSTRLQFSDANKYFVYPMSNLAAFSIYIKGIDGETINIGVGNVAAGTLHTLNGNWQRVDIYDNSPSSYFTINTYNGTARDIEVWGAQLEQQSYATSYIPTNGAIATRLADVATNSGNASLINSTEGVLYAEIAKAQDNNDDFILISLNNSVSNSDANSVTIGFDNDNDFFFRVNSPSGNYVNRTILANKNQFYKVALKYKSGDIAVWIDGVEVATSTDSFSFAVTLDNLSFDYNGNGILPFYGKTKALAVYKEALTDAELQSLTTI